MLYRSSGCYTPTIPILGSGAGRRSAGVARRLKPGPEVGQVVVGQRMNLLQQLGGGLSRALERVGQANLEATGVAVGGGSISLVQFQVSLLGLVRACALSSALAIPANTRPEPGISTLVGSDGADFSGHESGLLANGLTNGS